MITCYICNQAAPSHKLDCPNRLGPVTISANSARILNDDHAELERLRAVVERAREWVNRRGVNVDDRDDAYMDGYRAAQRHAMLDAQELLAILDGRADACRHGRLGEEW